MEKRIAAPSPAQPDSAEQGAFPAKLSLVLKLLSMSSAKLASELAIDKSVVSRWLTGVSHPSAFNMSRLTALIATRMEGFRTLDWERDLENLAEMFGADPTDIPSMRAGKAAPGLPIAIWDQLVSTAALRGRSYEGFFRSTRPHPVLPGRFVHDHGMIRTDVNGLPRLRMGSAGTVVDGWMLPLHDQLYCVAADVTSGTLLFGIFNGLGAAQIDVFDGLALLPGFDKGRAPIAVTMLCERVGDLTGDREADDRRCDELVALNPLAPEGSVPAHIQQHLVRDIGPEQIALGGEWLLSLPLSRSMTRGPDFDKPKA